ncbi:MAG: glycosyltransferase family 4 protein [Acidimicrobiales bacterium]
MIARHLVSSLSTRDATGNHTLAMAEALEELGYQSEFYVDAAHLDKVGGAKIFSEFPNQVPADDLTIVQFSSYSALATMLVARRVPVIVYYHNVTPAEFFLPWSPATARTQTEARNQIAMLAETATLAFAASEYSARELMEMGYSKVMVLPVLFTPSLTPSTSRSTFVDDPVVRSRLSMHGTRWLYVGRLLPHKAPHDLLMAFAEYRAAYDPSAVLDLVGADFSAEYTAVLRRIADELRIADQVFFWGSVDDELLELLYQAADVYVSTSLHEGFCVPILEAFAHHLPVVAVDAGAVAETLGHGGLLVPRSDPGAFATAVALLMVDQELRKGLVEGGATQLRKFGPTSSVASLQSVVQEKFL